MNKMNRKNINKENYFERLRELSDVKKPLKESINNSTLVNFVRASNNVAYAIIKENHNFFIKTSNKQNNELSVADFAYIGGLENKMEFQYNSLSEADKNRNFILININETTNKLKTNGTKLIMINEDISNAQAVADKNTAKDSMPKLPSNPKNISVDGLNDAGETSDKSTSHESSEEKESTDESYQNALFEGGKKSAISIGNGHVTKPNPSKDQKKADKNNATDSIPKKPTTPANIIHDGKGNKETPDPSKDQKKADKNHANDSAPKKPTKPSSAIVVEDVSNAQNNADKDNEDNAQKEANKSKTTTAPEKGTEKKIANPVLKGKEEKTVFIEKPKSKVNEAEDDEKDDIDAAASALDDLDAADAAGKAADAAADAETDAVDASNAAVDTAVNSTDDSATENPTNDQEPELDNTNTDSNDTETDNTDKKADAFGKGSDGTEDDRERKKYIGKLQYLASSSKLTDSETVADLKQILSGYKEAIKGLDNDQVQEIIGVIKKANDEHDDNSNFELDNDSEESTDIKESGFHKHMSECGYDHNDSNISVMEMAGLINSWANKLDDDNDEDGDFEVIAKYYSPEVEKEVNESGNSEFGNKIKPFTKNLSEDDLQKFGSFEPQPSSIEELFNDQETDDENDGDEDDDLEAISIDKTDTDNTPTFASPAILSAPNNNGSKTVSVDLKNQMITMNVTEAQIKAYIRKKLEEKINKSNSVIKENEEISDEKLKKEIDDLINTELKEMNNKNSSTLDQVSESKLKKLILSRIEERKGIKKHNISESLKPNSPLLKAIDKYIDEINRKKNK